MFQSERSRRSRSSRGSRGSRGGEINSTRRGRQGRRLRLRRQQQGDQPPTGNSSSNEEGAQVFEQEDNQNQQNDQQEQGLALNAPSSSSHSHSHSHLRHTSSTARRRRRRAPLCTLILHGLEHSPLLIAKLPSVRRLALIETLMHCMEEEKEEKEDSSATTSTTSTTSTTTRRTSSASGSIQVASNDNHNHNHNQEEASRPQEDEEEEEQSSTNQIDRKALKITLSNVQTSPYLSEEDFQNVVLEVLDHFGSSSSLSSSSSSGGFLTAQVSNSMAEAMLNKDWEAFLSSVASTTTTTTTTSTAVATVVPSAVPSSSVSESTAPNAAAAATTVATVPTTEDEEMNRLKKFRDMVNQILLTSRKIGSMSLSQRRNYGNKIHSASTINEIKAILTSIIKPLRYMRRFTLNERKSVKSHISTGRFDLLLLPESFDCDEKPRRRRRQRAARRSGVAGLYNDEEQGLLVGGDNEDGSGGIDNNDDDDEVEECVICFSIIEGDGQMLMLECNHWYCRECIYSWSESNPTCPTCRAPISANQLSSMRRTNYYGSLPIVLAVRSNQTYQGSQAQGQSQHNDRGSDGHLSDASETGTSGLISIFRFCIIFVGALALLSIFSVSLLIIFAEYY